MRLRCSGQSRLNETLLELSVARYSRTGMATIPKLMTPFQIDRGMPNHLGGRFPSCARPAARILTASSRKRTRCSTAPPQDEPEQPLECGGIAAPVLANDRAVGRAQHEAERESRDDRVIERADDRDELGNEIDRRSEPQAGDADDDLRGKADAPIAKQACEKTDQIREEQGELAREQDATDDDEDDDDDRPDREEDDEYLRPCR